MSRITLYNYKEKNWLSKMVRVCIFHNWCKDLRNKNENPIYLLSACSWNIDPSKRCNKRSAFILESSKSSINLRSTSKIPQIEYLQIRMKAKVQPEVIVLLCDIFRSTINSILSFHVKIDEYPECWLFGFSINYFYVLSVKHSHFKCVCSQRMPSQFLIYSNIRNDMLETDRLVLDYFEF